MNPQNSTQIHATGEATGGFIPAPGDKGTPIAVIATGGLIFLSRGKIVPVLTAAALANVQAQPDTSPKATVITSAAVIDGTGTPAQSGMTLTIEGKRITVLGKDGTGDMPPLELVIPK
jgi:hypothetical protein